MRRTALEFLEEWFKAKHRLPLVIRGARQVGKTWLVRHFAEQKGLRLIELNLERQKSYASFFASNDPKKILLALGSELNEIIDPQKSLLFIDEIQAVPEIFPKLRWFAEDMPELAVIATALSWNLF